MYIYNSNTAEYNYPLKSVSNTTSNEVGWRLVVWRRDNFFAF